MEFLLEDYNKAKKFFLKCVENPMDYQSLYNYFFYDQLEENIEAINTLNEILGLIHILRLHGINWENYIQK